MAVFAAGSQPAGAATAIEYYHHDFDHYFVTAYSWEAAMLDAANGAGGWVRTGQTYEVYPEGRTGLVPVCRFFSAAFAPKSSHFYTADPAECALVKANGAWQYEADAFFVNPPTAGSCPAGTAPLYRLYNDGQGNAPNHRYTTCTGIRDRMMTRAWILEGVRMCVAAGSGDCTADASSTASKSFTLTSTAGVQGGTLPADYTCDGTGSTIALSWSGAPAGTKEFALLMTTLPGDGTTKWNWVFYGIPGTATGLARDSYGVGTPGVGSDGPIVGYQPPCSQGTGVKLYTFTIYALSGAPALAVPSSQVTGAVLANAIAPLTLASASLDLGYSRTASSPGSSTNCVNVRNSTLASASGHASVACDGTYAYVGSDGIATHTMMDGITATNLQVPTAQNFHGTSAWKIPLNPVVAATPTIVVDGPVGVAINGVPIFNPCKQGGCQNGDTKVLGELDVCNGHAGRADDYHYHAAPTCLMAGKAADYWDTHPLGWALDGFAIFGYRNADGAVATRDGVCGGNTSPVLNAPSGYSYHVTDVSPYVMSCLRGAPSPDLANQGSKYRPMRVPPVTPFPASGMTLTANPASGYQVLRFTSARAFTTTETGADAYVNAPGTYEIAYAPATGSALTALLALPQNAGKSACWNFRFADGAGKPTQPPVSYCR
jgi:phosphatidylethanolamine-binding protein (PEBP) family uncharacterized protein